MIKICERCGESVYTNTQRSFCVKCEIEYARGMREQEKIERSKRRRRGNGAVASLIKYKCEECGHKEERVIKFLDAVCEKCKSIHLQRI